MTNRIILIPILISLICGPRNAETDMSLSNSNLITGTELTQNSEEYDLIDTSTISKLKKDFRIKESQQDNNIIEWYYHNSVPKTVYKNWVSCYFMTTNKKASNPMIIRIQCFGETCVIFKKVKFVIDGKSYEYSPSRQLIKRCEDDIWNEDTKKRWEYSEESCLLESDFKLLTALGNAKTAQITFIGSIYTNTIPVTQEEILAIKKSIDLYRAFDGDFK